MTDFIHIVPGDRVEIAGTVVIADERPSDWPRDWRHGVVYGPDRPCEPAGERCGPHGASWPSGRRCVIGALWDEENGAPPSRPPRWWVATHTVLALLGLGWVVVFLVTKLLHFLGYA